MTTTAFNAPWKALIGLIAAQALSASAFAATPPGGTVSEASPTVTWSGGPFTASNPSSCTGPGDPTCDNFNLTIVQPSFVNYVVVIAIDSTSLAPDADDYDLKVFGPDGSQLDSSASSGSAEQVALFNPAAGVYRVEVQPWAVTPASTYGGQATLLNNTPPPLVSNPPVSDESIFATPAMVDSQLHTGEPAIIVSPVLPPDGSRPLIIGDAPWGTSNATSLWWRSRDGGESFELVQDPAAAPRPRPCEEIDGGGDSWTAIDPDGRIYVNDLAALINITVGESTDDFQTMDCSKAGGTNPLQPIQDRQWIVATPDSDGAEGSNIDAFISFRRGLIDGNPVTETAIQVYQSTDGGSTYQPVGEFMDFFGFSNGKVSQTGNPVVDWSTGPRRGTLYQSYYLANTAKIGRYDPADPGTFETFTVAERLSDVGNVFVTLGIDTAGNLYYAWVEGGSFDVLFATSTDGGETWTSPVRLNLPGASELTVNPYLVAGSPGRVAVTYNGTDGTGSPDDADGQSWHYYVAQSLNALDANPSFVQYQITDTPLHFNSICTGGLGCSLQTPEGDRSLLEFNEVAVDPLDGSMVFIFADNGRESQPPLAAEDIPQPYIMFTRQIAGASMLAGKTIQNTLPRERSVTDRAGDSTYPKAGTAEGPQYPVLDLLGSRLQATDTGVRASIDVADLSDPLEALSVTYGTGDPRLTQKAVWVTRFEVVHNGLEEVYMLGMDLDRGNTEPVCFYGTPGVASSIGPKRSNYSSEDAQAHGAVVGSDCFDDNTINVEIPYAFMGIDFNTDPNPRFHSVTSFALVQPDATLDGNPVPVYFNNQRTVDASKAYDFEIGDFDADGLLDFEDNCIEVANPSQCDTNDDGFGNHCDADLNNDGGVTQPDLGIFRSQFNETGSDIDADLDCSGGVTQTDLGIFRSLFNKPPGPSAFAP